MQSDKSPDENYEQLVTTVGVETVNAVLEFMIARQLTPEQLLERNRERLDTLGEWIAAKQSELPTPAPVPE